MEELFELKDLLLKGDISGAIAIVEDLEEMSKNDIINTIRSYAVILLLHLIKQQAENRTTRSWEVSIRNSVREIQRRNKRRKAAGYYLASEELVETLEEAYLNAIDEASLEVEEGRYESEELEQLVNKEEILNRALALVLPSE
jgi:DNA polymerase III delta subunit